ncbi:hypothetical protein BGX38DRAFT_1174012, partial [Terfezia claveryi]
MVLDCMFYSQKDWNIRYTSKALRRSRMVKIACLSILLGLALWPLSSAQCAPSVLSQGTLFVRDLVGSCASRVGGAKHGKSSGVVSV